MKTKTKTKVEQATIVDERRTDAELDEALRRAMRAHGFVLQSNVIIHWRGYTPTIFGGHNGIRHAARKIYAATTVPDLKSRLGSILQEIDG